MLLAGSLLPTVPLTAPASHPNPQMSQGHTSSLQTHGLGAKPESHQGLELGSRCLLDLHLFVNPKEDKCCGVRGLASLSAGQKHVGRCIQYVSVVTCVIMSPGAVQEEVRSESGFEHPWTLLSRSPGKEYSWLRHHSSEIICQCALF